MLEDSGRAVPNREAPEALAQWHSPDHEHVGRISTTATIFVLVVVGALLYEIKWVLLPFVISGLVAYICVPAIEWSTARTQLPRAVMAGAAFVVLLAIGSALGLLAVPPLMSELHHLTSDLQSMVENLARGVIGTGTVKVFGQQMDAKQVVSTVMGAIRNWVEQPGQLILVGGVAFASIFAVFLTIVLLFYFLVSGPRLLRGMAWLVPPQQRRLVRHIWSSFDPVLKRYFIGIIVVVVYASLAAYVGLGVVLHIPHALFLAPLTGILEMVPMVGPALSAIIAGLVAVHYAKGVEAIIGYAVYAAALRLSIDQLLGPIALGTAARVHPVLIMFCFLT